MTHNSQRKRPQIRTLCPSPMLTELNGLTSSVDLPECGENDLLFIICRSGSFEFRSGRDYYYLSECEALLIHSRGASPAICFPSDDCDAMFMIIDRREVFFISAQLVFDRLMSGAGTMIALGSDALEVIEKLETKAHSLGQEYTKHKCEELILLMCLNAERQKEEDCRACTEEQLELARRAKQLINADLSKKLTIRQLADALQVSETKLKLTFTRVYGLPVYSYTKKLKMKKGAALLAENDKTILEIAGELGYDNGSKFSEAFRSVFGKSPREYRAENK